MKLPLDIYEILGVGVGSEARNILTVLERRLEKSTFGGFSRETLSRRRDMLTEWSKVLLDPEMRKKYDQKYTVNKGDEVDRGVEVQQNDWIAALILLLEAGHPQETLNFASHELHKWTTKVTDSGTSYRDLIMVIDYATLEYSRKLKEARYYEGAAEVIRSRLNDMARPVLAEENRVRMKKEMNDLLPYRVLDMLSRTNDDRFRRKGIGLLEILVRERGGLDQSSDMYMSQKEFVTFFHQIREYLTAQEQIELFSKWGEDGSQVSSFLAGIALVASGFAQRKAEKIKEALRVLEDIRREELYPIIANVHLLLGDIKKAEDIFYQYADQSLQEWATEDTPERLGQLCNWCQEWLARDVLPGYKDIRVEASIEPYFGDKDVIAYLEELKNVECEKKTESRKRNNRDEEVKKSWKPRRSLNPSRGTTKLRWCRLDGVGLQRFLKKLDKRSMGKMVKLGVIGTSAISLIVFSKLGKQTHVESRINKIEKQYRETKKDSKLEYTDEEVLREIIRRYHNVKKQILMGNSIPDEAYLYMSKQAIKRIEEENRANRLDGIKEFINVKIMSLKVIEGTSDTKRVWTDLEYSDETVDRNGQVVDKTPAIRFEKVYRLIRSEGRWLVN